MNNVTNLSEHFTLAELTKTNWLHFAVRPEGNRRKIRLMDVPDNNKS